MTRCINAILLELQKFWLRFKLAKFESGLFFKKRSNKQNGSAFN